MKKTKYAFVTIGALCLGTSHVHGQALGRQGTNSFAAPVQSTIAFTARPLPAETRNNLAKWGLTEDIWLNGTIADFASLTPPDKVQLEAAINDGNDAVALVLYAGKYFDRAQIQRLVPEHLNLFDDRLDLAAALAITSVDAPSADLSDQAFVVPTSQIQLNYLVKAANFGDPRAQWMLAQRSNSFEQGKTRYLIKKMYRLAAEGGLTIAMLHMSRLLEAAVVFEQNSSEASIWLQRCAQRNKELCPSSRIIPR